MGGCRHRSVAVGGSRKRSAAAKRRTARRVDTLHGSATWLGCSPTTGRRAAIFSNGASKINHLWSKKGSFCPCTVCGGWFCRARQSVLLGPRLRPHHLVRVSRNKEHYTSQKNTCSSHIHYCSIFYFIFIIFSFCFLGVALINVCPTRPWFCCMLVAGPG